MLRRAYFPDFKEGPKYLFWGNASDMPSLADFLRSTPKHTYDEGIPGTAVDTSRVAVTLSTRAGGLQPVGNNSFEWFLDSRTAEEFAEKVEALARASDGHQYLECSRAMEICVMVACNEYSDDLRP